MKRSPWFIFLFILLPSGAPGAEGPRFIPGYIYIRERADDGCIAPTHLDRIWEVNPGTREVRLFVEMTKCLAITSLVFTPDGTRLRAGFRQDDTIRDFDVNGNDEIVFDPSDGIGNPWPSNGMAYDAAGNFYVVNSSSATILRFPADGGPGEVFADRDDGVGDNGTIAFAPDGDMYYAVQYGVFDSMLRITPKGTASTFDRYGPNLSPVTLAIDESENLYVGLDMGEILQYRVGDASSREVLAPRGFFGGTYVITLTLDERYLLVASQCILQRVHIATGTVELVADLELGCFERGMAVAPVTRAHADFNDDEAVNLLDFAILQNCFSGSPAEGISEECQTADIEQDDDVDLADFALWRVAFSRH